MKRISIIPALGLAGVLALGLATLALAGTATGTTTILGSTLQPEPTPVPPPPPGYDGQAHANTPTDVQAVIITTAPVVPYEYSVVNKCWFDGKTSGPSDSYERFDLAGPFFADSSSGGNPYTIVSVNVQPVPEGAKCKVYIIRNNTVAKGSSTTYDVVP